MSICVNIYGVPNIDRVNKSKEARDIMNNLGIKYPKELDDIIESEIKIPITKINSEWSDDYAVSVKDIPDNVSAIVFSVSY